jgi:hypothetical protein
VLNAPTVGEGGNPGARNFLKKMDSRLRTPDNEFRGQASGMTAMKRTFCDVVKIEVCIEDKGRPWKTLTLDEEIMNNPF